MRLGRSLKALAALCTALLLASDSSARIETRGRRVQEVARPEKPSLAPIRELSAGTDGVETEAGFSVDDPAAPEFEIPSTTVLALSLGRSGNVIPRAELGEVVRSLVRTGEAPPRYREKFRALMQAAQMLIEIQGAEHYFPVGFEFESGHHDQDSWDHFEQGARSIHQSIRETVGSSTPMRTGLRKRGQPDNPRASADDDSGATWSIVPEYVRAESVSPNPMGWETISPAFFNRDYLRDLAGFVLRLGDNPYGREAQIASAQQTFDLLPHGVPYDPGVMGRTAVNYLRLTQQFAPAIFNTLEVRRYGGFLNFFVRPLLFDHLAMLEETSVVDPARITIQWFHRLLHRKHARAELKAHFSSIPYLDEEQRARGVALNADPQAFEKLWKYHDIRFRFDPKNPERTLVENRIPDYRQGSAEHTLRATLLNQKILDASYRAARAGEVVAMEIPARQRGESDRAYWERLAASRSGSQDALFDSLGLDPTERELLRGQSFEPRSPVPRALREPSYGFEAEFVGHGIVNVLVPKDPRTRARWRRMSFRKRVDYFASMIRDRERRESFLRYGRFEYDKQTYLVLRSEFEPDMMRYPFLDPKFWIESSGNFEIISNGRDIPTDEDLVAKIQILRSGVNGAYLALHGHLFVPDAQLQAFRTVPGLAERFGGLLERLSLYLQLEEYRGTDLKRAPHWLDSWSLDRYSPRDLDQVVRWLKGEGPLGYIDQKCHNIAVRAVQGGVDIEARSVGGDVDYMRKILRIAAQALVHHEFGTDHELHPDRALFHDFTDLSSPSEGRRFSLEEAVAGRFPVSEQERRLLDKMQFEIYKPSMSDYLFFRARGDYYSARSVADADMDLRFVRTNFETNVALPILNYEQQPYLTEVQLNRIKEARERFLSKVHALMSSVEKDPQYRFLLTNDDVLHLADWMRRSTHPTRPDFSKADPPTADAERRRLERLVKTLRRFSIEWVRESGITESVLATLPTP